MEKKTNGEQKIFVDAEKLSQGLKTAFEGVAMVFDSLGTDRGFAVSEKEKVEEKKKQAVKEARSAKERRVQEEEDDDKDTEHDNAGDDAIPDDGISAVSCDALKESEKKKAAKGPEESTKPGSDGTASAVSLDDVTKIIVRKIKKDRGNNVKIGQILKTYGALRVGELAPEKYEAFITDLAAL